MIHTNDIKLQKGINYELLNEARIEKNLTMEKTAELADVPEPTVKNILTGKTKYPRSDNLDSICHVLGIPMEKALRQAEKTELENQGIKDGDLSVLALKEIYEMQLAATKEMNEAHIANIRAHYEQHHEDLKENYERRLADKRELIDTKDAHIKSLERSYLHSKVLSWICVSVLVALLIAEVMNPNLGWLRY